MQKEILRQFVSAINDHDMDEIGALITDDHVFIDSRNQVVKGKGKILVGWMFYFDWFPDYTIELEKIIGTGNELAAFGYAQGTYNNLKDEAAKSFWRLPVAWKVEVRDNKIALWQVYADNSLPSQIVNRYALPAGEEDKVNGIGGVFFKAANPKALCKWYDEHLGTNFGENDYTTFYWRQRHNKEHLGTLTFSAFREDTDYFEPSDKPYMFNFRVNNLDALLLRLKLEGVQVLNKTESYDYGKFAWAIDPEGNKIELWEPMNEELFDTEK